MDESEADSRLRQSESRPAQDMCGTSIEVEGVEAPLQLKPSGQCDLDKRRSYSDMVGEPQADSTLNDDGGFEKPKRRRAAKRAQAALLLTGKHPARIASRLKGAQRVFSKPFHLSSLSMDMTEDNVIAHCRLKGVMVTGCYTIPTRRWGQSRRRLSLTKLQKKRCWLRLFGQNLYAVERG